MPKYIANTGTQELDYPKGAVKTHSAFIPLPTVPLKLLDTTHPPFLSPCHLPHLSSAPPSQSNPKDKDPLSPCDYVFYCTKGGEQTDNEKEYKTEREDRKKE